MGMAGPRRMPRDVVNFLNREINTATQSARMTNAMRKQYVVPIPMRPERITEQKSEVALRSGVVRQADIKPELARRCVAMPDTWPRGERSVACVTAATSRAVPGASLRPYARTGRGSDRRS